MRYHPAVPEPQQPPQRAEPREIVELRQLMEAQPELSDAANLQIELLQLYRRIQSRVTLPSIRLDPEYLAGLLTTPPILQFEHLPIDWSDARFLVRATASAMRTHEAIEEHDVRRVDLLSRDAALLPPAVRSWYEAPRAGAPPIVESLQGLEPVFNHAMRPFLTRAADAVMARIDLTRGEYTTCPLCAGEPDFAVITKSADRLLICSRCLARWRFDQITCPFCRNRDRSLIKSFASVRQGETYRLYCCEVCTRYIKAFDARSASRPLMPAVDSVVTLPLDAAAMQRGFH